MKTIGLILMLAACNNPQSEMCDFPVNIPTETEIAIMVRTDGSFVVFDDTGIRYTASRPMYGQLGDLVASFKDQGYKVKVQEINPQAIIDSMYKGLQSL